VIKGWSLVIKAVKRNDKYKNNRKGDKNFAKVAKKSFKPLRTLRKPLRALRLNASQAISPPQLDPAPAVQP